MKSVLVTLLLAAGQPAVPVEPYYPTDGNTGYDVLDYNVDLRYDPVARHLDATTAVTAIATRTQDGFSLDLQRELTVTAVRVNGTAAAFAQGGEHELVVDRALRAGLPFLVEVRYSGTPASIPNPILGQTGWQYTTTGGAFAAGAPHTATTWFPANDVPTDKATLHVTATVPEGWSVISNGLEGADGGAGGWHTFRWRETRPMSTYLSLLAIDRWTIERSRLADGTPVVSAYAPGAEGLKALQDRLPEILDFLAGYFGPYPQQAAGGVFLADPIGFSMETQTRPIYAAYADLSFLVHENAHQWFGDTVTVRNWRDVCISECFASYATWMWAEAKEGVPTDDYYRWLVGQFDLQPTYWTGKLYDMGPGEEFNYAVYLKGPAALHALRRLIGDPAFLRILKLWPVMHRYDNASLPEFQQFVERQTGRDLSGFFGAWFSGTTRPADAYLWPGSLHQ